MVVVAVVVEGIKAVVMDAVAVADAGILGDMDAVEAVETKEGDGAAVNTPNR